MDDVTPAAPALARGRGSAPAAFPDAIPGGRSDRAYWLALLAVALIVRLAFVFMVPDRIQWPDGREYEGVGRMLVERGTYGMQTLRPPGYPTLIAAVYAVFGESLRTLRLVEAVLGTLAVGLIGVVGTRSFGRMAGIVSATLAALHPVLSFLPSTQFCENTLVLVVTLAFASLFGAWRRGGAWRWALAGALFGIAILIRPNAVLLLPGLGVGLFFAARAQRRRWTGPALAFLAGVVLALGPWVVRNHQAHDRWFFVVTGGGRTFWYSNNPRANAETAIPVRPDSAMLAVLFSLPDDIARENYYYRQGRDFMRRHPGRAAVLFAKELRNLYSLYPEPITRTYINRWSRWAQGAASAFLFAGVLMALARFRAEPALWVLAGGIATFSLGSAVFLTLFRYRMAIEPCLLWMAGLGWSVARSRWETSRGRQGGPG